MEARSVCFLFFAVILHFCSLSAAVDIEICDTTVATFDGVESDGCVDSGPVCHVKRGTNSTTHFHFTPSKDVASLTAYVAVQMGKVEIPTPLDYPKLCDDPNGGLKCPLEANKPYTYSIEVPVMKNCPKIRVNVHWDIRTQDDEPFLCMLIPVKVIAGDDE